jgi:hypothetical protein
MNRSVIAGYSNKVPALAGFKMSSSMLINTRNTGRQTIQVSLFTLVVYEEISLKYISTFLEYGKEMHFEL